MEGSKGFLKGRDLSRANLEGIDICWGDLREANLEEAIFADVNLVEAEL